jgi:LacI family transcriptional regulator
VVVIECSPGPDAVGVIEDMSLEGVDGIILAPPLCDSPSAFDTVRKFGIPAVTIGSSHHEDHISSLRIDDFAAAREMTRYLLHEGHQKIAFIVGKVEQTASGQRLDGFLRAMADAGASVPDDYVVQGEFSYRSGMECANRLLALDDPPTAIFCSNDDMAAGAMSAAQRAHLDVPEDLTVCGFDDTMLATTVWPEITTIRQPISRMSKLALELLERNIRQVRGSGEHRCEHKVLDFALRRRGSDAPPRSKS